MEKLSFCIPVSYADCRHDLGFKLSWKEWLSEKADSYLYLGGKVAYVIPKEELQGSRAVVIRPGPRQSLIRTVLKVVSYLTLLLPALMLAIKWICRPSFHISYMTQKLQLSPATLQKAHAAMAAIQQAVANNPQEIQTGSGEYVVYHHTAAGKQAVTRDEYNRIFEIFKQHLPHLNPAALGQERYEKILNQVKAIHADLEIAFIPRTLQELIFLRQGIEEDLARGRLCSKVNPERRKDPIKSQCWHTGRLQNPPTAKQEKKIQKLSWKLNNVIVDQLPKEGLGLNFGQITQLLDQQLHFFQQLHESSGSELSKKAYGMANCNYPGPTTQFAVESSRGAVKPMGIADEEQKAIVRHAVALECSEIARNNFLLYRGGNLKQDLPWQFGKPYSLSYGIGLFAGGLFDGGATAFHFMRKNEKNSWLRKGREAYVIPIPFEEIANSPFHIPRDSIVRQIASEGENFHGRSKCWQISNPQQAVGGFDNGGGEYQKLDSTLKSSLDASSFCNQFIELRSRAIMLKG